MLSQTEWVLRKQGIWDVTLDSGKLCSISLAFSDSSHTEQLIDQENNGRMNLEQK